MTAALDTKNDHLCFNGSHIQIEVQENFRVPTSDCPILESLGATEGGNHVDPSVNISNVGSVHSWFCMTVNTLSSGSQHDIYRVPTT